MSLGAFQNSELKKNQTCSNEQDADGMSRNSVCFSLLARNCARTEVADLLVHCHSAPSGDPL